MPILTLVLIVALLFFSGYFSTSETALFSLSSAKVKAYQAAEDPRKKMIATLLRHPRDLLVTVFMLNTLVNILLQNAFSHLFWFSTSWTLKVGLPLSLTLLLGEVIPKYIGMQNNASIAYKVAPFINFFQNLLKPIRKFVILVTAPISRCFFFFLKKEESISKEELQHVLKTSELHGVLSEDEADIVWGYLNLQDSIIKEFMRPREEVLFYDIDEPLTKLIYLMCDQQCTRLPVCKGDLQNVLGVITAKTFLLNRLKITKQEDLIPYLSKAYFIPENTVAHILLHRFEKEGMYFAVVVDEYGALSGIITREDLLEVVIGKIYGSREEKTLFSKANDYEIVVSGKLEINQFNDIFHAALSSPSNMVTIAGWLIERAGEIPKQGTKLEYEGFLFHIIAADKRRINRLYIRKLKSPLEQKGGV